jgi:hypothetical protein
MWTLDVFGSFVLIAALATVLLLSLIARSQRAKSDLPIWLVSTLGGMLLGAGLYNGYFSMQGYEVMSPQEIRILAEQGGSKMSSPIPMPTPPGGADSGPGAGPSGPPGPGGPSGPAGGMVGRTPTPKRQLSTLVRKLELLTGDIAIRLSPAQAETLGKTLVAVQAKDKMTDDEAKAAYDELLAVLDDRQQSQQDSISLPFRRGAGGPGGGGPGGGGPGGGGPGGGGPGGAGPMSGPSPAPDANPFADEEAAKALATLIERLGGPAGEPAPDAPAQKTEPAKTESLEKASEKPSEGT